MTESDVLLVGGCESLEGRGTGVGASAGCGATDVGLPFGAGASVGSGLLDTFVGAGAPPAVFPKFLSMVSHLGAPESGLGALLRSWRNASGDWNCGVGLETGMFGGPP